MQKPVAEERIETQPIREQTRWQEERPNFAEEKPVVEGENKERRKATPEEMEQMDRDLEKLGDIFEGSDVRWQLDGALNISLMKGEYIGAHKDVDLTIDPDDLPKLEEHLSKKGYGLFIGDPDDPTKKKMVRASAEDFLKAPEMDRTLCAIDEQGRIKPKEHLNYMDVHFIKRNEAGEPIGYNGETLPKEWYEPRRTDFHGREISLSHPAKIAYFKLFAKRQYDQTDLQELADIGKLTEADLISVETAINQGFENRNKMSGEIINRVAPKISGRMKEAGIAKVFAEDPALSGQLDTETGKQRLQFLATGIARLEDRSPENIKSAVSEMFGFTAEENQKHQQIESLRRRIKDNTEMQIARNDLDQKFGQ